MFKLLDIVPDGLRPSFAIVDIGAADLGPGTDPYHALLAYENVTVFGFEPNQEKCRQRNADAPRGRKYFPQFVGDGSRRVFHATQNPFTSSLYRPDDGVLSCFQRMDLPVVATEEVDTVRLDDVAEIGAVDFLKIDVQGAELDVLRGAGRILSNTLVIHTEVEFIPIYASQPLYSDIDVFLRGHGFLLHKFIDVFSRQMKPMVFNGDLFAKGSQVIYAEAAVFARNFHSVGQMSDGDLLKTACIMHDVYGSYDFTGYLLHALDQRNNTSLLQRYIDRFNSQNCGA
ncbi:FkbM family methyltransferase [Azospirillum sp.]|uniref:FkbM family methyltransferase n=1 Tax=Azospirillum sp. TaxID=34012 RepID=UPI003D740023